MSRIGQLDLLSQRFEEGIIIPQAVWHEVVETGSGRSGANEVRMANWIAVRKITNSPLFALLHTDLDKGESEAIALSIEEQAYIILLDERSARRKAVSLGLTVLGTVGIFILAKDLDQTAFLGVALAGHGFKFAPVLGDDSCRFNG